jgi:hypothetical protein
MTLFRPFRASLAAWVSGPGHCAPSGRKEGTPTWHGRLAREPSRQSPACLSPAAGRSPVERHGQDAHATARCGRCTSACRLPPAHPAPLRELMDIPAVKPLRGDRESATMLDRTFLAAMGSFRGRRPFARDSMAPRGGAAVLDNRDSAMGFRRWPRRQE